MDLEDRYWLAGLLEGEGSFHTSTHRKPSGTHNYAIIEVSMTDEDVIRRAGTLMGAPSRLQNPPSRRAKGWKPQWRVRLFGSKASSLMRDLRPLMGERRRRQIDDALKRSAENSNPSRVSDQHG
jgi:hypothetical protein